MSFKLPTTVMGARARANTQTRQGATNGASKQIIEALVKLGPSTAHDVAAYIASDYKRVSVMLSYLRATSRVRHVGKLRLDPKRKPVALWGPGAEPVRVIERINCDAITPARPRKSRSRRAEKGPVTPPPYRYGFLWLNAAGVPR